MEKTGVCEHCGGIGFVKAGNGKVKPCECRFRNLDLNRLLGIPKRFKDVTLENYVPENPSQDRALLIAKRYVFTFNPEEGKGLTFVGSPGVGKTHLAVGILKAIYEKTRVRGLFFDTKDLIYRIKASIEEGKDRKIIKLVLNYPLLVLDDLGSERLNDWQRELISYIISQRYNNMKSTIITTNYSLERGESLSGVGYDLSSRLGENVVSKIYEMNEIVIITGRDRRKEPVKV
ncbi:MAG: ATP-binding protein [Aquificae bacterium]|nr:ATP-binding protein [Aquificota bacterium]